MKAKLLVASGMTSVLFLGVASCKPASSNRSQTKADDAAANQLELNIGIQKDELVYNPSGFDPDAIKWTAGVNELKIEDETSTIDLKAVKDGVIPITVLKFNLTAEFEIKGQSSTSKKVTCQAKDVSGAPKPVKFTCDTSMNTKENQPPAPPNTPPIGDQQPIPAPEAEPLVCKCQAAATDDDLAKSKDHSIEVDLGSNPGATCEAQSGTFVSIDGVRHILTGCH